MNEMKYSIDKLLHLVNNDISLIVGVLRRGSTECQLKNFLKLFFSCWSWYENQSYKIIVFQRSVHFFKIGIILIFLISYFCKVWCYIQISCKVLFLVFVNNCFRPEASTCHCEWLQSTYERLSYQWFTFCYWVGQNTFSCAVDFFTLEEDPQHQVSNSASTSSRWGDI